MKSLHPFNLTLRNAQLRARLNANRGKVLEHAYLKDVGASQIVERLRDVTRKFPHACEVASTEEDLLFRKHLEKEPFKFGIQRVTRFPTNECDNGEDDEEIDETGGIRWETHRRRRRDELNNPLETFMKRNEASFDLIVSNLEMHWLNDLPTVTKAVARALKPDGCFIGCMLGGETLHELRGCLSLAEQEREGGVSPHVSPMLPVAETCGLLNGAGLKLVTVDTATVVVEFDSAFELMRQLWWMGESNAAKHRRGGGVSRETMMACAAAYHHMYGDRTTGLVPATFEFIFMIGWAPHESQMKPLKPGIIPDVSLVELGHRSGEG